MEGKPATEGGRWREASYRGRLAEGSQRTAGLPPPTCRRLPTAAHLPPLHLLASLSVLLILLHLELDGIGQDTAGLGGVER